MAQGQNMNGIKENSHLQKLLDDSLKKYSDSDFNNSKKIALQLLEESFKSKSPFFSANAYNVMAMNDEAVTDYVSAKEKYIKSKEICLKNNYPELLMLNYNGIGSTWVLENKDYETSNKFYEKSLHLADSLEHVFKHDVIVNIVWNQLDNEKLKSVSSYINELEFITTLDIKKHNYNRTLVSTAYLLLARYYAQIEQFGLADSNFNKATKTLNKLSLYEQLSEIYFYRSRYEEAKGNYKEAYHYLKEHIKNKEIFIGKDLRKNLMLENARYRLTEYERALIDSKRESLLMEDLAQSKTKTAWLYSILSIFLLLVIIMIYRENKIKNRLINTLNKSNKDLKAAKKEAEIAAKIKADFISNICPVLK